MADLVELFKSSDSPSMENFNEKIQDFNKNMENLESLIEQVAASGAKIQTGSYVGTGTYGASNPCSLTFDFAPITLCISGSGNRNTHKSLFWRPAIFGFASFSNANNYRDKVDIYGNSCIWENNSVKWYNTSSSQPQMNDEQSIYYWYAIG